MELFRLEEWRWQRCICWSALSQLQNDGSQT